MEVRNVAEMNPLWTPSVPHGADFENVVDKDEAELRVEGFSLYLKKGLVRCHEKSNEMSVTGSKGIHVRGGHKC